MQTDLGSLNRTVTFEMSENIVLWDLIPDDRANLLIFVGKESVKFKTWALENSIRNYQIELMNSHRAKIRFSSVEDAVLCKLRWK